MKRTSIKDISRKKDIIEHINNDHIKELKEIVFANSSYKEIESVKLFDIFEEGCLLKVEFTKDNFKELFVRFTIKGNLEEKILYIAYKAMVDNGKPIASSKKQYFEVIENTYVTTNMLRLTVKSNIEIPSSPAFAYLFSLKKLEKVGKTNKKPRKAGVFTKFYGKFLLFVMKLLSSKQRSKLLRSMNKNNRYYTVRKSWKKNNDYFAFIDVYIHGKTNGGNWAKTLQQGTIILSVNQYKEKSEHLNNGKALLIADETSLPAIASIIEQWKNPVKPHIIAIINNQEEQNYLDEIDKKLYTITYVLNSKKLVESIIKTVEKIDDIETIWGALEKETATELRKYFRNTLKIEGKKNRVVGYWKKD